MNLSFSPIQIAQWLNVDWHPSPPNQTITGISIDSRTLQPGNLYVALSGEHFDGHQFLKDAIKKGAAGAIIKTGFYTEDYPFLAVSDPLLALQNLAKEYKKQWNGISIAITGSVGKTTVKEMCAAVLATQFNVHRTHGNLNNHIGLPLTLLSMPSQTTHGLFELGMNHTGEISTLTKIAQPDIGILTDIGAAHLEHFSSIEEIAKEKGMLLKALPKNGLAILDATSPWFNLLKQDLPCRIVTFAINHSSADYIGQIIDEQTIEVQRVKYKLPLPGDHMLRNAMRAIVLGLELKIDPLKIAEGLTRFQLPPMRWETSKINEINFINDAYNANPISMRAALQTFAKQSVEGKKWVVLGGMRELGKNSSQAHAELGAFVENLGFNGVLSVGSLAKEFDPKKIRNIHFCPTTKVAADFLKQNLLPSDTVLLKASRGEALEQIINYFKEN